MKKPKVLGDDDGTLDRISELPDPLLVKILSLLPTKDAFTTCVIARHDGSTFGLVLMTLTFICSSIYSLDENFVSFVSTSF